MTDKLSHNLIVTTESLRSMYLWLRYVHPSACLTSALEMQIPGYHRKRKDLQFQGMVGQQALVNIYIYKVWSGPESGVVNVGSATASTAIFKSRKLAGAF